MKIIHLSDLHLGMRLNEYSLIEDQEYILNQILDVIDCRKPDVIVIAGDVYDRSVPSAEAVCLLDKFLTEIAKRSIPTFVSSGNHDSAERLAFGSGIISNSKIYMSPVFTGEIMPVEINDEYGGVNIYMLPYLRHTRAIEFLENFTIDTDKRNVLVAHQFVTGAGRSDSEEVSVGGSDNIDSSYFAGFDYVALGHLHKPQNCKADNMIRYCGTPLKYSFSEVNDEKSVTVVTLAEKGNVSYETVALKPLRDLKQIKGKYADLMRLDFYKNTTYTQDYMKIILTDEDDVPEAMGRLRSVYTNLMDLKYDNKRTQMNNIINADENVQKKTQIELFRDFFHEQNNSEMSEEQEAFVSEAIKKVWGEEL